MSVSRKIVHGGMPARRPAGPPGSRVIERISCGVPIKPSTTAWWAAAKSLANRRLKPTWKGTPAASVAAIAWSISSSVSEAGFSHQTGFPAAAARWIRSR